MFSYAFCDITEMNNFALDRISFLPSIWQVNFYFYRYLSLCPDSFRIAKILELVFSLNGLPDVVSRQVRQPFVGSAWHYLIDRVNLSNSFYNSCDRMLIELDTV